MRNEVRSFVTRDGQVIEVPAEDVETQPPQQQPPVAARGGGMDMSRFAAFVLLGFVCLFLMTLVAAGIYRAGKWAFSGNRERTVEAEAIKAESNRRDTGIVASQKPFSLRTLSYTDESSGLYGESQDKRINQQVRPSEVRTYDRQPRKQEIPIISTKPAVNYWDSINEMKDVLEARSAEIKKITEDLRNTERGW